MEHDNLDSIDELISQSGFGNRDSFCSLYDKTAPKLYATVLMVLKDRSQAEAALVDTFDKIWTYSDRFMPGSMDALVWLNTIARNTAIDHAISHGARGVDTTPRRPLATTHDETRDSKFYSCLKRLDETSLNALRMIYFEGARYEDLVERLDIPLAKLRHRLRQNIMSLQEYMAQ